MEQFLSAQAHAMYAMDFFTVDTLLKKRYYVLFIIHRKTREIVQFAITQNPTREFLRQQMIEFPQNLNTIVYLIHDNAQQFTLRYLSPHQGIDQNIPQVYAPRSTGK